MRKPAGEVQQTGPQGGHDGPSAGTWTAHRTRWGTGLLLAVTLALTCGLWSDTRSVPVGATPAAADCAAAEETPSEETEEPGSPTGRILNVRDYGALGTGKVNDRDAVQRTVFAAEPGDIVYFPAGYYLIDDGTHIGKDNLTLMGDGPSSIIGFNYRPGFRIEGNGRIITGTTVKRLRFIGLKGLYKRDGNSAHALTIIDARRTVVSDCDFEGAGYAVFNGGGTYGTKIDNIRVKGWGTVAIYCNGGEQITNCSLVQDDPRQHGQFSSHGIYIHSGAKDVLVADTLIEKARYYGAQIYGNDIGTVTSNVRFERVIFKDCYSGLTIQQGDIGAALAKDILIKDCSFLGTYTSPALGIKQGDGIQVLNNVIDGTPGVGFQLGAWAPYEPGYSVNNLVAKGNVIRNCDIGIWAQASWGGTFSNVQLSENTITGCRLPLNLSEAPGVSYSP